MIHLHATPLRQCTHSAIACFVLFTSTCMYVYFTYLLAKLSNLYVKNKNKKKYLVTRKFHSNNEDVHIHTDVYIQTYIWPTVLWPLTSFVIRSVACHILKAEHVRLLTIIFTFHNWNSWPVMSPVYYILSIFNFSKFFFWFCFVLLVRCFRSVYNSVMF